MYKVVYTVCVHYASTTPTPTPAMATLITRAKSPFWFAQFLDPSTKKRKRVSTKVKIPELKKGKLFNDAQKTAQRIADDLETAFIASLDEDSQPIISVKEYLEGFTPDGKHQNQSNARRAFAKFLEFLGSKADDPITTIKRDICEDFLLWDAWRVSSGQLNNYRAALSKAFKVAWNDEILPRNPWANITDKRCLKIWQSHPQNAGQGDGKQHREVFTPDEIYIMLFEFTNPWRDLAAVSYFTAGTRISDCMMLKWEGVKFDENLIILDDQKTSRTNMSYEMHDELRKRLEALYANRADDEYVFPRFAYMKSKSYASTLFVEQLINAGILTRDDSKPQGDRRRVPKKSFHGIRHTANTTAHLSNINAALVTKTVGHKNEAVNLGYLHAEAKDKTPVINALYDVLPIPKGEQDT